MLTVNHITKSFNLDTILDQVSFTLNAGERLALVGPNGCGKTTLLRILVGEEQPDTGTVSFDPPNLRLGYLAQGFGRSLQTPGVSETPGVCDAPGISGPLESGLPDPGTTMAGYLAERQGDPHLLSTRLEHLAHALANDPRQVGLQRQYDTVLDQLTIASQSQGQTPAVLAALGLGDFLLETPVAQLSGGQKTRLALAGVLLADPQLLILDEPTNHLDIEMLEWLEDWLLAYRGAVLLVSHDRAILDRLATGILELDPDTHQLCAYPGNYTAYLDAKVNERQKQWQEYKDQQETIARLRAGAARMRADAKFRPGGKGAGDTWAPGFFANRTKETIQKAKHIEKRIERMLTTDKVEKPKTSWQVKLDFGETTASGQTVLRLEHLSVGYGDHILLREINRAVKYGDRIALVGANGAGKTSLLKTILGQIPALGGVARLGTGVKPGYMAQEQENLDPALDAYTVIRQHVPLAQTEARAFLHRFLFIGDDVFRPVGLLSYGERARLALACLIGEGCNLLLLDEPINHLDIPSRARFEQALSGFEGTVLAIVHDRYFIAGFASQVWRVEGDSIQVF